MRDYESIFILNPNIDAEEAEKVTARMQEVIAANSGEMVHVEKWGKRKLAYEIKKFKKGEYVLFQYTGTPATVSELERNFKMTDPVIKFITVKMEKEAVAAAEAQRVQAAATAQAAAQAAAAQESAAQESTAQAAAPAPAETPAETPAEPEAEKAEAPEAE